MPYRALASGCRTDMKPQVQAAKHKGLATLAGYPRRPEYEAPVLWQRRAAARDPWPNALCASPRAGQLGTSAARGASLVSPVLCAIYGDHQRQPLTLHVGHSGGAHALLQGCGGRAPPPIPSLVSRYIALPHGHFCSP